MPEFPEDIHELTEFLTIVGKARFKRYLDHCNDDPFLALRLYLWNAEISNAFYTPLQIWEICLRNRLNGFLCWKFGERWPFAEKATRQLKAPAQRILQETIEKQARLRGTRPSTDMVVADLSAGFWVQLLGQGYAVPFSWRYNLPRVFPSNTNLQWRTSAGGFDMTAPHALCEFVVELRYRVAHHEPLAWLNLDERYYFIGALVFAMSPAAYSYLESSSQVPKVLSVRPS